jgi:hypothetical protein
VAVFSFPQRLPLLVARQPLISTTKGLRTSTHKTQLTTYSTRFAKMSSPNRTTDLSDDINQIASFLAHSQVSSLEICESADCVIICASSVLYQASHVFSTFESLPSLAKNLVLVGGIGHSTSLIYDAVARYPEYHELKDKITGLPEADVLQQILNQYFHLGGLEDGGPRILVENRSTNCGANAVETRRVLEEAGITGPVTCIVVQDPTMSLRTIASFEKAYGGLPLMERPIFKACPGFVPRVRMENGRLGYVVDGTDGLRAGDLWEMQRFCELLVGEVARLKDDENGYGPRGKGFIGHVDVPVGVVRAAERARETLGVDSR